METLVDVRCADCGGAVGEDSGPRDGWKMPDGRTVCHDCCRNDLQQMAARARIERIVLRVAWPIILCILGFLFVMLIGAINNGRGM